MRTKWLRAGLFGILGTVLFDIAGLLFTGNGWGIPALLARAVGVPWAAALVLHYGIGVTLAVFYAALVPLLIGPGWFHAIFFTSVESLVLVWFLLFPLSGLGIAGLGAGIILPILSMARHWAYAMSLAYYLQIEEPTSDDGTKLTQSLAMCRHRTGIQICCPNSGTANISLLRK